MKKIDNPIIMHINYFEQGQSIEYTVRRAKELGYDGIEFRRSRQLPDETPESYLGEIKRCSELYGMKYTLFGAPGINAMTRDWDAVTREIDGYKRFLDAAEKRGLLTLNNFMTGWLPKPGAVGYEYETYGSACAEPWHWENAAKACRIIADYAPQVKFAFETHMGYIHDLAPSARKLVDLIDRKNFGINLDYGNAVYFASGSYPTLEESIDICGEKLFYTHLKNSVTGIPRRLPTSLSQGDINHRAYLQKLQSVGFTGFIGIEAPRSGDREWYAAEDIAYLRSLISDCNG
jgi:sugar phosphate isomerase/epimerase